MTQVQGRFLLEEFQGRPKNKNWRKDLDSTTAWSNSRMCKYMKKWRRRLTPSLFLSFFLFLSSLIWLSSILTCEQEGPIVYNHSTWTNKWESHEDLSRPREALQDTTMEAMKIIFKKTSMRRLGAILTRLKNNKLFLFQPLTQIENFKDLSQFLFCYEICKT